MATRLNRAEAATEVIDLHREHQLIPASTSCTVTFPGDELAAEAVYVLTIEGDIGWPVMQAGGVRQFDDIFEITIEYRTADLHSEEAALTRTQELLAAGVEALNLASSNLGDLDGVVSAEFSGLNGPLVREMRSGFVGFGQGSVTVHSRITPT